MKKNASLIFYILVLFFLNSCKDDGDEITNVSIKYFLGIYKTSSNNLSEDQYISLNKVFVINSKEQGNEIFDIWNMDTPRIIEEFDYNEYTFLLRFFSSKMLETNIEHFLYYEKGNKYEYKYLLNIKGKSRQEDDIHEQCYYTGIYFYFNRLKKRAQKSGQTHSIIWHSND
jgi:hypothetical protein